MRWTPYAPSGLLAAWSLTSALGCTLTGVWVPLMTAAVVAGTVELKGRYRDR